VRALESNASANHCNQCIIRVVSNDGGTFRSPNLVDFNSGALSAEHVAGILTNRKLPRDWSGAGQSVNSVVASADDRIVIEIGVFATLAGEENETSIFSFGDNAASDCAENETATNAFNPWIEFSADLFGPPDLDIETTYVLEKMRTGVVV